VLKNIFNSATIKHMKRWLYLLPLAAFLFIVLKINDFGSIMNRASMAIQKPIYEMPKEGGLIYLPTALMWTLGKKLDEIGNHLKSNPYLSWKGLSAATDNGRTYSFFSMNLCMLPGPLPTQFGGVTPAKDRFDEAANYIRETGADLVFLQEVSKDAANELVPRLGSDYSEFYAPNPNPQILGLDSGLFIASKIPVKVDSVVSLPSSPGLERKAVVLSTKGSWIITTHLAAGDNAETRAQEMGVILDLVQQLKAKESKPVFLVGDLNIDRGSDEYKQLISPHFRDGMKGGERKVPTATDEQKPLFIDYVLVDRDSNTLLSTEVAHSPETVSDHRGLFTQIVIQ
jgi:endonuclease/exonuclease/phosphatase family metal-dependent hydrolase